jgi:general secretion pathway protein M
MDSLKQSELGRWYALAVLLLIFLVIYFLLFHGFVSEHGIMNEEITDLESNRKEYTELKSQIPELQKRINEIKESVGDNTNFLVADTYNLGSAELTHILKNIVNSNTEDRSDCNIVSNTSSVDREPDQFEKIIIKVRMRCHFDKMMRTLSDIENHVPILFIDNLELDQRPTRHRSSRKNEPPQTKPQLDVRFDLFAYMNKPVKVREND